MKKRLQIWVMGSAADLWYAEVIEEKAFEIGKEIAKRWHILIFGAEKDVDSLSSASARWAKEAGGLTVWVTYWRYPDIYPPMKKYTDVIINSGMDRGGGREFVLVASTDAIIALGGGSWTLNEITIAYQKKIPIVVIKWTWGRADKLADTYIDERYKQDPSRPICRGVNDASEALNWIEGQIF